MKSRFKYLLIYGIIVLTNLVDGDERIKDDYIDLILLDCVIDRINHRLIQRNYATIFCRKTNRHVMHGVDKKPTLQLLGVYFVM